VIVRALDRGDPPGRAAGMIGTVLVHAAAATFLFTQARSGRRRGEMVRFQILLGM